MILAIKMSVATVAKPLTAVLGSAEDHLMVEIASPESEELAAKRVGLGSSSMRDVAGFNVTGVATLIWGAPHCGQNGTLGATSALHR